MPISGWLPMFVTSSFLHFYFDGFIWKVSEKQTQQNLVDKVMHTSIAQRYVPAFMHAGKWAVLIAIIGGLFGAEYYQASHHGDRTIARLQALAALTPELPESQSLLSRQALAQGNATKAIEHARRALVLRPKSHALFDDLGLAYMQAGLLTEAKKTLQQAIDLAPGHWEYHCDLGKAFNISGEGELALAVLQTAISLRPPVP